MSSGIRGAFREVFEEFIHIYRNESCLWHVKNKNYHNREKENAAYNKLVEKLMEFDPSADAASSILEPCVSHMAIM